MTKQELISEISKTTGQNTTEVAKTVESLIDSIKSNLKKGESIYIRGFATITHKKRAAKKVRNISKATTIDLPAHNIPVVKFSKEFKEEVKASVKA